MSHQNEKKFQTRVQEEKLRIEKECENILNCERDKLNIEIKNLKEQNEKIVKNNHEEIGKYTKKIKIIEEESQKTTRLFEQMLAET